MIQVVPLTSTVRGFAAEVTIEADSMNGLQNQSAAQCQHIRAVSMKRVDQVIGNLGVTAVSQIRDTLGLILDIPGQPRAEQQFCCKNEHLGEPRRSALPRAGW